MDLHLDNSDKRHKVDLHLDKETPTCGHTSKSAYHFHRVIASLRHSRYFPGARRDSRGKGKWRRKVGWPDGGGRQHFRSDPLWSRRVTMMDRHQVYLQLKFQPRETACYFAFHFCWYEICWRGAGEWGAWESVYTAVAGHTYNTQ